MKLKWVLGVLFVIFSQKSFSTTVENDSVCVLLSDKLESVQYKECVHLDFDYTPFYTTKGVPMLIKEYPPKKKQKPRARILFLGGIHGDELTAFSATIQWMKILKKHHSGLFHWIFLPAINMDGLLVDPETRYNARGVDLNRNFSVAGNPDSALKYWKDQTGKDKRRYPGDYPESEVEVQAIMSVIRSFNPDVIVSVHAPLGVVDFDGGLRHAPAEGFGALHLHLLGTYPGSLGNYGWKIARIPVLTLELKNAGIMPPNKEIHRIWNDLVKWLIKNV